MQQTSTRMRETQPFSEAAGHGLVESDEPPSLASVLTLVMERVNARLDAVEEMSVAGKAAVDALQEQTTKLRSDREAESRTLNAIHVRLQALGVDSLPLDGPAPNLDDSVLQTGESPSPSKQKKEGFASSDAPLGETCKPKDSQTCKLTPNPFEDFSFSSYLSGELKKGVYPESEEKKYATQEGKVKGLFYTPFELEKFMAYGLLHCFDCFLYLYTLLPVRVCLALFEFIKGRLFGTFFGSDGRLTSSQWLDIIRFFILLPTIAAFYYLDTSVLNSSVLYHLIRTQTFVKLYFLYNMIDICDRLFSSVGQDLFDAIIYYVAVQKTPRYSTYAVLVYAASLVVQALHCALTMLQYTILLVAFNSHNKVLLVLMLSNNFGELKSTVFKRFSSHNLFQMSCSDVRERFQYILLLVLVLVRVLEAYEWRTEQMGIFIQDAVAILLIEVVIDWIKQSFITKFNDISYEAYAEYSRSLAYDLLHLGPGQQREHFDHICRRMGLTPIPMACIFTSVLLKTVSWRAYHLVLLFPILVALKMGCHLLLLHQSYSKVHSFELRQHQTCRAAHSAPPDLNTSRAAPNHRRFHRRTRSQFDLPLRRDRHDCFNSETSTALDNSYLISDSESECAAQLLLGPSLTDLLDDSLDSDNPLVAAKRSKSLSQVRLGDVSNLLVDGDEMETSNSPECEMRCRARTSSGHTEEGDGGGMMGGGEETGTDSGPGPGSGSGDTGLPSPSQMALSDVDRYSMCSSQIV